jgi:hypothetical protein
MDLELSPPTSLNTEECLNQLDLNPLDQCRPNKASSLLNKVVMADHLSHRLLSTTNLKWLMEVLLVLVVTAAGNNNLRPLNGTRLHNKALAMALVDTKVKETIFMRSGHDSLIF